MKRFLSIALALVMVLGMASFATAEELPLLTVEIYDVAANDQGLQSGWYGKVVKDKFNMELNIIAPQQTGDAQFATRSSAGFLGDLVLLDNADMQKSIAAGLIYDMTELMKDAPNLQEFSKQIAYLNNDFEGVAEGQIYAIPMQMTQTSPTSCSDERPYISPKVPWDYFSEIGAPDLETLDDLLVALRQIQDLHPTNDKGDPAYAFSLWDDWDGNYIETAGQLTKLYGQEAKDSMLIGADGSLTPLNDKDGAYYKILKFFNKANQMGLVDPDSASQDWNAACDKMKEKRVYLMWYSWQLGFWNTPERGNARENYELAPVKEIGIYQESDSYYGDGRCIAIGSKVTPENAKRLMAFLDWYASPEGATILHDGLLGYNYIILPNGKYDQTETGLVALMSNTPMPEVMGGGNYNDGISKINQWIVAGVSPSPLTGEPYSAQYWETTIARNNTTTLKEWSERFGAAGEMDYLKKSDQLKVVLRYTKPLPDDGPDIGLIRSQCKKQVCEYSWRVIFAKDDAEFDALWDEMTEKLEGFGWDELVDFDTEKLQVIVDTRAAAQ